jgi:adenosylhomocysteinase
MLYKAGDKEFAKKYVEFARAIEGEADAVTGLVKKADESQVKSDVKRMDIGVYVLPKILDEQVALLHLDHVNAKLTKMTPAQVEYMSLPVEGPFKPEMYRY